MEGSLAAAEKNTTFQDHILLFPKQNPCQQIHILLALFAPSRLCAGQFSTQQKQVKVSSNLNKTCGPFQSWTEAIKRSIN